MRTRVKFELMISRPTGGRYGADKRFAVQRTLSEDQMRLLGLDKLPSQYFSYKWDDGYGAGLRATVMEKGERLGKSDGFCGYEWMVKNLLRWGTIECHCEWVDDPHFRTERDTHDWERCIWCGTHRPKPEAVPA